MVRVHRPRCVVGLLALLLGSGHVYSCSPRYRETCRAAKQAAANSEHVVEEIEPLCRIVAPEQNTLLFVVAPASKKASPLATMWIADCSNSRREDILHIVWDEAHRRLVSISRVKKEHCVPFSPVTDSAQAEAIAWDWLTKLSLATGQDLSHASCQAQHNYATWTLKMETPDCHALVWLNSRSGTLMQVIMYYSNTTYASTEENPQEHCHHTYR